MSSGMPELGSKISLISKADIRYEGRLFTVDPQECTIALASVRSFGTEDRETQYPVAPQSQVYDYILFRGSDIKDIRVLNNVPSLPNDPAIMQMSVPAATSYAPQFGGVHPGPGHPVSQPQYPQYHPMAGFPGSVHAQLNKTSELSTQSSVEHPPPVGAPLQHHSNQLKEQGSMLDLIGGGAQQNASRSNTPAVSSHRKSPTADQGTQVGSVSGAGREGRRGSTGGGGAAGGKPAPRPQRPTSRTRQRYPSGGAQPHQQPHQPQHQQPHQQQHQQQHHQHQPGGNGSGAGGGYGGARGGGGGWRGGRGRGRGRGFVPRNKNTLKFDNDYDFEQANTEFEELRTQLAKTKITDEPVKLDEVEGTGSVAGGAGVATGAGVAGVAEGDKKDDSGNETGAGEPEPDDDAYTPYDKTKSFFDNISCEAVERSKGRSQRTDWRTERKLNSETFGVASARRGAWRQRASWRHNPHHQQMSYFPTWRGSRGARGRPHGAGGPAGARLTQPRAAHPAPHSAHSAPPAAAAK